ncbi:hypothetical protein ANO14919_106220 [Xylariales sp. No.14919]|nr:hypothetical protein ANO14919_106220 [Xylariales sp. No.14919]
MDIQVEFLSQGDLHHFDICLKFAHEPWYCIGTVAQGHPNQMTMSMNMHPSRSTEAEIHVEILTSILHEFCHALGLVYTHNHLSFIKEWLLSDDPKPAMYSAVERDHTVDGRIEIAENTPRYERVLYPIESRLLEIRRQCYIYIHQSATILVCLTYRRGLHVRVKSAEREHLSQTRS